MTDDQLIAAASRSDVAGTPSLTSVGWTIAEGSLVLAIAAFHVVDHELVHERWHVLTHASAGLAAVGAALALGVTVDDLGLAPAAAGRGLAVGGAVAAAAVAPLAIGAALPRSDSYLADPRVDDAPRADLARRALLDIPIGTAVYEELVFRSALLGLTLRRVPTPVAVAITSVVFGFWHVLPAIEDRRRDHRVAARPALATVGPTVLGTAVAGAGFAVLRLRSGSVLAPIIVHAATNVGALVASTLTRRRRRRTAERVPVPHEPVASPA
jgi:uncharacterized protein